MPSKTDYKGASKAFRAGVARRTPGKKMRDMRTRRIIGEFFRYAFLTVAAFVSVFPFFWMIVCSTNNTVDVVAGKMWFGGEFVRNFKNLFANDLNYAGAVLNSAIISVVTTLFALLISSLAGYGFEIFRSGNKDRVFSVLLCSMMVPFCSLMVPLYRMFSSVTRSGELIGGIFGLNTFASVILPSVSTAFLIFFFRQNSKYFPRETLEAARIDGLSEIGIFFKMYMPVMKSTYAAGGIITFMSAWNNYLWPLVTLSGNKRTAPLILAAMGSSYTPDYGMIMLGIVIATLPTALIFFLLQKQFVAGMLGSVK